MSTPHNDLMTRIASARHLLALDALHQEIHATPLTPDELGELEEACAERFMVLREAVLNPSLEVKP